MDINNSRGWEGRYLGIVFPPPPLDGNDAIVPISRPVDLMHEGYLQKNCVMHYIEDVLIRRAYFYSVLEPERATLRIDRKDGTWTFCDLLRRMNKPVQKETRIAVENWLLSNQGSNHY